MKLKGKHIAHIIIILTGIIILSHSAISHHHHQGRVCIEDEHLNCSIPLPPGESEDNHQTSCFISEYIPEPSKDSTRLGSTDTLQVKNFPDYFCLSEIFRISLFYLKAEPPEPDIKRFYTSIYGFSSGLRAPPTV